MRLSPLRALRCRATFVLAMAIVVLPSSIATAGPILLKFDATLTDSVGPESNQDVDVISGVEIAGGDGTAVGDLFFDPEFIDVTSNSAMTLLAYSIYGGGEAHSVPGYAHSWPIGTTLEFSDFLLNALGGRLDSVDVIGASSVIGAGGGSLVLGVDYIVNDDSLLLNIGGLGILAGPNPLGLMTFRLNFEADEEPPTTVPDAASSLTLLGMGMAALAAGRRLAGRRLL